jgi:hypothetical protein
MRAKHTAILMPGTTDIQPNKYRSSRAIGRAAANRIKRFLIRLRCSGSSGSDRSAVRRASAPGPAECFPSPLLSNSPSINRGIRIRAEIIRPVTWQPTIRGVLRA